MKMANSHRNFLINIFWATILLLHLRATSTTAQGCPHPCTCRSDSIDNIQVNCSKQFLLHPPKTPASTLTLDLSHNALGPILNATFTQMRNLTLIDISHNAIAILIECTFNGMLGLKTVRLGWNRLTSVPDGLFTDANKVEHLDLSHNLLTYLPDNPFKNLPELKTLDVSYNLIGQIKLGPRFQVLRHIQVIDLSHNPTVVIGNDSFEVAAGWQPGINRTLNLAFCRISSIESGSITKIPHLYDLDISGNSGITAEMLKALVIELESEARNLHRLSLAYMNLTSVFPLFTQVSEASLKFLNVSFNNIRNLPENVFSTIRGLRVLDLSRNKVTTFSDGLSDLVNLQVLNISHNALVSFYGNNIDHLSNLHTLDMSHNSLADSNIVNISTFTNLNYLNVNNNFLTKIVLPRNTSNLRYLDYHANRITEFPGVREAPFLESVDVSDNEIGTIKSYLFRSAKFLKMANFSKNSIENIDQNAFLPHSPLAIDVSNNFLKEVYYSNWVATQRLFLSNNKIHHIDQRAFNGMTGLQELDLSRNGLARLHEDLFHYLSNLKQLNLSHNGLGKLGWVHLFNNLEQLEALDLGHNNISHLSDSMLAPLTNIRTISFQANNIQIIIPRVFRDVFNLKVIDLSQNPFDCVCDMLAFKDWLKRTKTSVLGLYTANSTAYHCRTPHSRAGLHVLSWQEEEFECNRSMLYLIISCSVVAFLVLVGVIAIVVHRYYKNWKRKSAIKRKLKEEEAERKKRAAKKAIVKLSNQEIAQAIKDAVERKRRHSPRKHEMVDGHVNYVHQSGHAQRPSVQDKRRRHGEDRKEFSGSMKNVQGERDRSGERQYEKLKMAELAMEAVEKKRRMSQQDSPTRFTNRYSHQRADHSEQHGERRQSDHSSADSLHYDRRGIPLRKHPQPYEEATKEAQLRERDRMFHYKIDPSYRPVAVPARRNGPYVISAKTLPKNWDSEEVWIIPQRGTNHGYRSRSQDHRMYGYHTVTNGDANTNRRGRESRLRERYRDNSPEYFPYYVQDADERGPIYYTRQHRDNPESYYDYQRSQSYNFIPQAYTNRAPKRDRAQRQYESIEQMSRRTGIGLRAVSQPALPTEHTSNWL